MKHPETHIWHPFDRESYRYEWRRHKLIGVIQELGRDIKHSYQRIRRGYCGLDVCSIDGWFLGIMPAMLQELKDNRSGSPVDEDFPAHAMFTDDEERKEEVHTDWDNILDRMIFLLKEASEMTCSRTNPYEDEYFVKLAQISKSETDALGNHRVKLGLPEEHKALEENYKQKELELEEYRKACKNEALELFSRWFYCLWD